MPIAAFDAPGPRVTNAMPGRPVSAFLTADDQAQAIANVVQRVEHRQIALPGDAEREIDSLEQQVVDEYAAAGAHRN